MQKPISPLILSFGAADPIGATGIQADLATFAAMGCQGVCVITSLMISDTTGVEDVQAVEPDILAEQARAVLEDMPIAAFKIGAVGSTENVAVIAEIMADYPDIPLILDPFYSAMPDQGFSNPETVLAIEELLVPQSTLFLLSANEIIRLAEILRENNVDNTLEKNIADLLKLGCAYLFITGTPCPFPSISNTLYDTSGTLRHDVWPRIPGTFLGAGSTLSGAITALLAMGLDISDAVLEAQEFTMASLTHAERQGMGKLIPNRYFWAQEEDLPPPLV